MKIRVHKIKERYKVEAREEKNVVGKLVVFYYLMDYKARRGRHPRVVAKFMPDFESIAIKVLERLNYVPKKRGRPKKS